MMVNDYEYLLVECQDCGDKAKIARDKSVGDWKIHGHFLREFLEIHGDCDLSKIRIVGESPK